MESGFGSINGVFTKCESCGQAIYDKELETRFNVCPHCEFHYPLSAPERIRLLVDAGSFEERDVGMMAEDPLSFDGYEEKLQEARQKTGLDDALVSGVARIGSHQVALAAMDFRFIGGSMGSVVGERVVRTIESAYDEELPLLIVSSSGGARMYEGIYSLMQMAKTSVALSRYVTGSWPYVSVLTDPTFGGSDSRGPGLSSRRQRSACRRASRRPSSRRSMALWTASYIVWSSRRISSGSWDS